MSISMRNARLLLLAAVVILLIFMILMPAAQRAAADPQAPQASDLSWNVVASGGTTMSSASYTLMGTVGQPVAGESTSAGYSLLSGYWTELRSLISEIFLPVIRGV